MKTKIQNKNRLVFILKNAIKNAFSKQNKHIFNIKCKDINKYFILIYLY